MTSPAILTGTNRAQIRYIDLRKFMSFLRCTIISRRKVVCVIHIVIIFLRYITSLHTAINPIDAIKF